MEEVQAGRQRELGQVSEPPRQFEPLPGCASDSHGHLWAPGDEEGNRWRDVELPSGRGIAKALVKYIFCSENMGRKISLKHPSDFL